MGSASVQRSLADSRFLSLRSLRNVLIVCLSVMLLASNALKGKSRWGLVKSKSSGVSVQIQEISGQ